MGMADQIVIKRNLWNVKVAEMKAVLEQGRDIFMPIIADDAVRDPQFSKSSAAPFQADAVELIDRRRASDGMTRTAGRCSARVRARSQAVATGTCG